MPQTLRPREFGELLGQTFSVFFKCFGRLLAVHLIFWLPFLLLALALVVAFFATGGLKELMSRSPDGGKLLVTVVPAFFVLLIFLVLSPVLGAASLLIVADEFTGKSTPLSTAFRAAFQRLFALITLGLAVTMIMVLPFIPGLALFIIGTASGSAGLPFVLLGMLLVIGAVPVAFYFFSCYAVANPPLVVEGLPIGAALRRSKALTEGFRLKLLGLLFIISILVNVVSQFFEITTTLSTSMILKSELAPILGKLLSTFLGQILGGGIGSVFTVVIYFDLRVRKEAFDLENIAGLVDVIAARAGLPPAPPAPLEDAGALPAGGGPDEGPPPLS